MCERTRRVKNMKENIQDKVGFLRNRQDKRGEAKMVQACERLAMMGISRGKDRSKKLSGRGS